MYCQLGGGLVNNQLNPALQVSHKSRRYIPSNVTFHVLLQADHFWEIDQMHGTLVNPEAINREV